jgi:biotin transporter BioY
MGTFLKVFFVGYIVVAFLIGLLVNDGDIGKAFLCMIVLCIMLLVSLWRIAPTLFLASTARNLDEINRRQRRA